MLAEDTAFNEEVATELLAMVHMDVDCAHNGKEAVELFEKAKPGTYMAILMDIHMPVMNGYEAARTIRKSEREDAGTIAIYAMTANSFEEDVSAALNAGMNGHIANRSMRRSYMKFWTSLQKTAVKGIVCNLNGFVVVYLMAFYDLNGK